MIETSLTFALRNFMVALYVCSNIGSVLLFSSADHRDEWTLDNPRPAAPVCWWCTVGHPAREFRDIRLLAVTTATNGVDSTTRRSRANCIMKVFVNDGQASSSGQR